MRYTLRGALAALGVGLIVASCGSGSADVGVSSRPGQEVTTTSSSPDATTTSTGPVSTVPATTTPSPAPGMQFVTYGDVRVEVPADWPVHDLAADPVRCVLATVHAVYLGHQGPNANCPARAEGRTETVHLEALDTRSQTQAADATAPATINGIAVRTDPASSLHRAVTVAVPGRSALITITYRDDPSLATRISESLEYAG